MSAEVRIEAAADNGPPRTYVYGERATVVAGRSADCGIRAPAQERRVSRHHCVFDVAPPALRVRDLGSRNGTYVNGVRLPRSDCPARDLADGDEVRIGRMRLRVHLGSPDTDDRNGHLEQPTDIWIPDHTILREIGQGAQGTVYLARHHDSPEPLALKVLRPEIASPEAVSGFLREIETTRALRHPHIVRFRAAGSSGPLLYLACEFCDGGDLGHWVVAHEGPVPAETAVALMLQVLDGLAHAHTVPMPAAPDADGTMAPVRGLVHRDIKPQNLLLSGSGPTRTVKIADFGLAKAFDRAGLSDQTRTGALGGSVAFMPRAQIVNYKFARPGVDVWATAACLYWMLTRATPRDFPPGADPVLAVLRQPVIPAAERGTPLPARLATLLDDILTANDPTPDGGPSAREFHDALREAGA